MILIFCFWGFALKPICLFFLKFATLFKVLLVLLLQSIPPWWLWSYYICPIAWTLRGIISSQLGDVETKIVGDGFEGTVKEYLDYSLGYGPGMVGVSVAVLIGFCLLFYMVFAISVKVLNFQKRWMEFQIMRKRPVILAGGSLKSIMIPLMWCLVWEYNYFYIWFDLI